MPQCWQIRGAGHSSSGRGSLHVPRAHSLCHKYPCRGTSWGLCSCSRCCCCCCCCRWWCSRSISAVAFASVGASAAPFSFAFYTYDTDLYRPEKHVCRPIGDILCGRPLRAAPPRPQPWSVIFWTENWHTGYSCPGELSQIFWLFYLFFVYELGARADNRTKRRTDGQTDRRQNPQRNLHATELHDQTAKFI